MEQCIKDFKADMDVKESTLASAMAAVLNEIANQDTDLNWAPYVAGALSDYYYLIENIKNTKDTDTL